MRFLRSPMYQFDEDELAYLRINHPHGDFYSTITDYSTQMSGFIRKNLKAWDETRRQALNTKVQQFNQDLSTFRVQAKRSEIAALIWNIYTTTGFFGLCWRFTGWSTAASQPARVISTGNGIRKRRVLRGCSNLFGLLNGWISNSAIFPEMKMQVNEDTVKFMTIHKSKGLEYPVVFVTDLSKRFNMQDLNHKYVLDDQFGIGVRYR